MKHFATERNSIMDKKTKTKVMMVFVIAAFLMLFAFQGKAEESVTKEPASVEETTTTPASSSTEATEEEETEDTSTPAYYPNSEDSGGEDYSFDE
jgi:hypothetical protein